MPVYALDGEKPDLSADGHYYIADTAVVIGRVRLKRDASVWFGSTLRGDNEWIEVGERSNVQENCTFHTDKGFPLTIGPACTIGHNVILHGCTIGENTLIGMGAILLNGAKIGRNSLVGAGALVTEGKQFEDNSLIVGSPARVLRRLDEEAVKRLADASDWYVQRWHQYAKGLQRID
jgi:carbonic anhydrase/acetyltransferase-like protein (isoleucine patch superfamily)